MTMFTRSPKCWLVSFVALCGAATPLAAQNATTTTATPTTYPAPPYYGYYGGGGGGYGGWGWGGTTGGIGSTAAGSYLGGLGMAIRAQGQYNLMTSQAAINLQEAQKQQLENQVKWTNTYFEKRRINQAYKDASKGIPSTKDDWVRRAREAAPNRIGNNSLDPVTGQLNWPRALQADAFAAQREKLDQLFAERASTDGAVGIDTYSEIRATVDDALATLKDHIRDIDPRNYLEARTFLTGLAREADFPTG